MRTPNEIKDASLVRFNELAGVKFDVGQSEHKGCLDQTVTFAHMEEECVDLWHYLQSMKYKNDALELEIVQLKAQLNSEGGWPEDEEVD
jgi:hypothetical protein